MTIGRLAVDARYQGQGLGRGLLRDALLRTLQVAEHAGIRAVLLHAMTADAKRFYQRAGFHESPLDPMTMMIAIADVEKALATP
jgi:GNAT superfamily N-acetyltransferase